jgi:hypothetical protein
VKLVKYRLMTFEKQFCNRCTRNCYCILVGTTFFCQACFEVLTLDPETRVHMKKIMDQLPQIENE